MSKFVEMETSKQEPLQAASGENALETPVTAEAVAEGGTETVMESTSMEPATSSSGNLPVESMDSGTSAAQETVAEFVPAAGKNLRKLVYNGLYYVSFGATFSALVVANLIPTDSLFGEALADGAETAKDAFRRRQEKRASGMAGSTLEPAMGESMAAA